MSMSMLKWQREPFTYISREEYNDILYRLRNDPELRLIPTANSRRAGYFYNTWQHIIRQQAAEIRLMRVTDGYEVKRFKYMNSQLTVEEQNDGLTGADAYDIVDDLFKNVYGISLERAFSSRNMSDYWQALKDCVPIQPHYASRCDVTDHGYKADVSSAFGSQCLKPLPTLKGSIVVNGRSDPSTIYPFAFYLKSHHFAIYGEFDTREFGKTVFYNHYYTKVYDDFVAAKDEVTILCPACECNLGNIVQRLYDDRGVHPENKKVINACIGMFHCRSNPRLAHVAAVIIGRCVYDMCCVKARQLVRAKNTVHLISTDSIIWAGRPSKITVKEKFLGAFVEEESDVRFCVRSSNCYQYERRDGTVVTRYSGQIRSNRGTLKLGEIFTMSSEDIRLDAIYPVDGYFLTGFERKEYEEGRLYHGEEKITTN